MAIVLLAAVALTGCAPKEQGQAFRDPASGRPALFVALCDGERIDAVELTIDGAPAGLGVLWRIERGADAPAVEQVVVGEVPVGYAEVLPLREGELPERRLELIATLAGGGAAEASSSFIASALGDDPGNVAGLREAAAANCNEVPIRPDDRMSALAALLLLVTIGFALRVRSRHRLHPRPGWRGVWRASFGLAVALAMLLLLPWGDATRVEPVARLGTGAVIGLFVVLAALVGQGIRRWDGRDAGRADLIPVVGILLLFVFAPTLYFGTVEGGFTECGPDWTFDCAASWPDRVLLLLPLVPAWWAAVMVGEGGWWIATRRRAGPDAGRPGSPPVKRAVALVALVLVGLIVWRLFDPAPGPVPVTLPMAAYSCEVDLVTELLAEGADTERPGVVSAGSSTWYPLEAAVQYCGSPVIDALLAAGASPDLPLDEPLLHTAVRTHNRDAVEALLAAGADPAVRDGQGERVLTAAADWGDAAVVAALLAAGLPPDEPTGGGARTPLFAAASSGHAEVVGLLLAAGADPNRRTELTLLDLGAYVYSLDEADQAAVVQALGPPLGLAPEVVASFRPGGLVEAAGTLATVTDLDQPVGSFPLLYIAAVRGDAQIVEALLAAGADPSAATLPTGHLPRDAALLLGHDAVVAMLP